MPVRLSHIPCGAARLNHTLRAGRPSPAHSNRSRHRGKRNYDSRFWDTQWHDTHVSLLPSSCCLARKRRRRRRASYRKASKRREAGTRDGGQDTSIPIVVFIASPALRLMEQPFLPAFIIINHHHVVGSNKRRRVDQQQHQTTRRHHSGGGFDFFVGEPLPHKGTPPLPSLGRSLSL